MPFKVEVTPEFFKETKKLAAKYPSLKNDLIRLADTLSVDPTQGTSLGKNIYKIRLSITSKGRGKSGGARVITCVKIVSSVVYLVSIYDKSAQSDISDNELRNRINKITNS